MLRGEPVLDAGTNTARVLHAEYGSVLEAVNATKREKYMDTHVRVVGAC